MKKETREKWEAAIKIEDEESSYDEFAYAIHDNTTAQIQALTYSRLIGLYQDYAIPGWEKHILDLYAKLFDLKGKSVVDIAGGSRSLLLRCTGFSRGIVVDPGKFPDFILQRYKDNNIEVVSVPAEEFKYESNVDEVWLYNALAYVYDPYTILESAKNHANVIRIVEELNAGTHMQHLQNLTAEELDKILGRTGRTVFPEDTLPAPRGPYYVGVFEFNNKKVGT